MMHASSSSSDETLADPILISETERLLQELQDTNRTLLNVIQRLEDNQPLSKSIHLAIKKLLHHYAKWLLALPNLVATFVWLSMLLYFTGWYLSLPRDEKGRHPQICESFSLWPYISCIGEKKPSVFRGVCITMAVLISISFLLFCHLSSQIAPGLWLRRTAALFAVISSCALITLSFKSIDSAPKVHLVATTIQIFSMGNTKFFDWLSNAVVRKSFRNRIGAFRRVRPLEVARWLKSCVAAFAAGM
jgi:Na+/H+ antiporter NhaD/arsenite permease-like protein